MKTHCTALFLCNRPHAPQTQPHVFPLTSGEAALPFRHVPWHFILDSFYKQDLVMTASSGSTGQQLQHCSWSAAATSVSRAALFMISCVLVLPALLAAGKGAAQSTGTARSAVAADAVTTAASAALSHAGNTAPNQANNSASAGYMLWVPTIQEDDCYTTCRDYGNKQKPPRLYVAVSTSTNTPGKWMHAR